MKIDQLAYYCDNPLAERQVKSLLGLTNAAWVRDEVQAVSSVWGAGGCASTAVLQFNYDLGIELEIIRYTSGRHWHDPFIAPVPFISHVGVHLEDGEEFPTMAGCRLAQETFTISHTSEYLTTGAGAGRKYHYRIFEMSSGNYIKYIRRIHPPKVKEQ